MSQNPNLWAHQVGGPGMEHNTTAQAVQQAVVAHQPTGLAGAAATAVASNIDAVKLAARLKAGEAALATVKNLAIKVVPASYAQHLENPFVQAALANAIAAAITQLRPGNAKAEQVSQLLIDAAWVKVGGMIDVEGLFDDLFDKIDIGGLF